jgi:hypothetical protein
MPQSRVHRRRRRRERPLPPAPAEAAGRITPGNHAGTAPAATTTTMPAGQVASRRSGGLNSRTKLTAWQLAPVARTWATGQIITFPIQFGSSG